MRVWFRKIHCPSFVCFFCKPNQHLCTPTHARDPSRSCINQNHRSPSLSPLPRSSTAVVGAADHLCNGKKDDLVDDAVKVETCSELILKSSIKRKADEGGKKTVKWMDVAGKELVQVKEFEISESEDTDSDGEYNRGCICPIL